MYKGQINAGCGTNDTPYTGKGRCDVTEGLTISVILTSTDALYPLDSEQFKGKLEDYVSDSGILRMLPIKDVINDESTGGDINTSQVGYGPTKATGISAYNNSFTIDAGLCLYKELARVNGKSYRVFRVDKNGYIYGTVVTKGGVDYFAGFEATVYTTATKATDLTTSGTVKINIYYGANYENEFKNVNMFEIDEVPSGLIGVELVKSGAGVKVVSSCSGEDYTSQYGESWDNTMFVNQAGVPPSNVVFNENTDILSITPAESYKVANAAKLKAGDIFGLEGINKYTTV